MWAALRLPGLVAGERLAAAGRALAGVLLDPEAQAAAGRAADGLSPEDTAEVVLCADGDALALPVELIRLRTGRGRGGGAAGAAARGVGVPPPAGMAGRDVMCRLRGRRGGPGWPGR